MKEFEPPMVCISPEEYKQLQECKRLINLLWMQFGPHQWPAEFRMPRGKTFLDFHEESHEFKFYQFRSRMDRLMDYDDSE
jgi:hypothetical protein